MNNNIAYQSQARARTLKTSPTSPPHSCQPSPVIVGGIVRLREFLNALKSSLLSGHEGGRVRKCTYREQRKPTTRRPRVADSG